MRTPAVNLRSPRWLALLMLVAAVLGGVLLLSAIANHPRQWLAAPPPATVLNGAALEPEVGLPPLTFARSDGDTFTTEDTRGRQSLFYFGYTHCADVCPLSLGRLGQVRRALGDDAARVDTYFVTLDPLRDTPERMQSYMANFQGVVGLRGSEAELSAARSAFNITSEVRDAGDGNYTIDHTAAMFLVNVDSRIALAYPYGTSVEEITADLRQLVHDLPAEPRIVDSWARPANVGDASAVYLRIQNPREESDRLLSVRASVGTAEIHQTVVDGDMMRMRPVDSVMLPAGGELQFKPGGLHVMLTDLQQRLVADDSITLSFGFERAGTVRARVPVRARPL